MNDDDLRGAVRALRDEAQGSSDTASATRMRILGAVRARRRRNVTLVRATAVLLAAALGGVAWAATTGRLPSLSVLLSNAAETDGIQEASAPRGGGAAGGRAWLTAIEMRNVRMDDAPSKPEIAPGNETKTSCTRSSAAAAFVRLGRVQGIQEGLGLCPAISPERAGGEERRS